MGPGLLRVQRLIQALLCPQSRCGSCRPCSGRRGVLTLGGLLCEVVCLHCKLLFTLSTQSQPASSEHRPPPRRGDRFPLPSGPRVWSSAAQRFTGSPGSGLHRYLLLDPTARRKPEQGQHTRTSVLPGESLSHGGSTGMREAGEGEGCQQLERRRDSSRVQEECCGTGSGGFFR